MLKSRTILLSAVTADTKFVENVRVLYDKGKPPTECASKQG